VHVAGLVPPERVERIEQLVERGRLEEALNVGTEQLDAAGLVRSDGPITGRPPEFLELARTLPREIRAVDALGNDLARYASLTVPTLVLVGAASPPRQQRNCRELAAVLPDVQVEQLDGLGHVAHNADPDRTSAIIGAFLGDLRPSTPSVVSSDGRD
jgi:pimeloyl-ACP methyl ester carboxylesterase